MILAETVVAVPPWAAALSSIAVTVGLICQVVLQVLAKLQAQRDAGAAIAAAKGAEKTAVATGKKVAEVHALVNGGKLAALRLVAELSGRVAGYSGTPADAAAAAEAEARLRDHETRLTRAGHV